MLAAKVPSMVTYLENHVTFGEYSGQNTSGKLLQLRISKLAKPTPRTSQCSLGTNVQLHHKIEPPSNMFYHPAISTYILKFSYVYQLHQQTWERHRASHLSYGSFMLSPVRSSWWLGWTHCWQDRLRDSRYWHPYCRSLHLWKVEETWSGKPGAESSKLNRLPPGERSKFKNWTCRYLIDPKGLNLLPGLNLVSEGSKSRG